MPISASANINISNTDNSLIYVTSESNKIEFKTQEERNWCWAACVYMVLKYYNLFSIKYGTPNIDLCAIVKKTFTTDCCQASKSSLCNKGLEDPAITDLWKTTHNIPATYRNTNTFPLLKEQLEELLLTEIENNRPIQIGYAWTDPLSGHQHGGHLFLICGYTKDKKTNAIFFSVQDPGDMGAKSKSAKELLGGTPQEDHVLTAIWSNLTK